MCFLFLTVIQIFSDVLAGILHSDNRIVNSYSKGVQWSYHGDFGPQHWLTAYPHCGGRSQSPIHIDTSKVSIDHTLTDFHLQGYDLIPDRNMTMSNNGHTVQVNIKGNFPQITGGGLQDSYSAAQFHFHWGSTDSKGSEHAMDGKNYPMEMHLVHYANKYGGLSNAVDKPNGLKVLGFFFEIGQENPNFDHLISRLTSVEHKNSKCDVDPFPLRSLMPEDLSAYYRYHGSLTTPPCYESVIWTVFKNTIKISKDQMDSFRHKLKENSPGEKDEELTEIYRPVQPLNSRNVYASRVFEKPKQPINTVTEGIYNTSPSLHSLSYFPLLIIFKCFIL